jgi:PncC family amidohydrolase
MSIDDLASRVAELLDGRAVASAESCTAGRISEAFAAVEGASTWFAGALVAYQEHAKRSLLHVRAPSVLSTEAAAEMAEGIARLLEVPVAVATTGVAGDEPVDGVGPGVVFIATRVGDETTTSIHRFEGSPDEVCDGAAACALSQLVEHLSTERTHRAESGAHSAT